MTLPEFFGTRKFVIEVVFPTTEHAKRTCVAVYVNGDGVRLIRARDSAHRGKIIRTLGTAAAEQPEHHTLSRELPLEHAKLPI